MCHKYFLIMVSIIWTLSVKCPINWFLVIEERKKKREIRGAREKRWEVDAGRD